MTEVFAASLVLMVASVYGYYKAVEQKVTLERELDGERCDD